MITWFGRWIREGFVSLENDFDLDDDKLNRVTARDARAFVRFINSPQLLAIRILLIPILILLAPIFVMIAVFQGLAVLFAIAAGVVFLLTSQQLIVGNFSWQVLLAWSVSGLVSLSIFVGFPLLKRTDWFRIKRHEVRRKLRSIRLVGWLFR
ncbi:MAG: hypothetical protein AB8F26_12130 [Phycisphaerales bacterium]